MTSRKAIDDALALIFQGIDQLSAQFPNRKFTIDGRLVGDIGEVIAALEYGLVLDEISQFGHDGIAPDGRRVQVKATFKDHLTFRSIPDYYLGFKLFRDGRHEEVFNGPGHVIAGKYGHWAKFGNALLSFPVGVLRGLSAGVDPSEKIPRLIPMTDLAIDGAPH